MSVRFVIDPLEFVKNAGNRHDKIPLDELARLHDLLFDREGEIIYHITGRLDQNEKPGLHLRINGKIHLNCQRCLDKLVHTVDLETFLLLAKDEFELDQADEDDSMDAILATSELDILSLIEEEVILSLSISSRHAEGECSTLKLKPTDNNPGDNPQSAHPFAALAALKKAN
ncbi:YceD family protein [Nitrosomonas sp. wSCUT-2]